MCPRSITDTESDASAAPQFSACANPGCGGGLQYASHVYKLPDGTVVGAHPWCREAIRKEWERRQKATTDDVIAAASQTAESTATAPPVAPNEDAEPQLLTNGRANGSQESVRGSQGVPIDAGSVSASQDHPKATLERNGKAILTPDNVIAARKALNNNGYPFWLPALEKQPVQKGWQQPRDGNDQEAELWVRSYPNALNTGLQTRLMPTLDADFIHDDAIADCRSYLNDRFGDSGIPLFRYGRKGFASPFQATKPFKKISVSLIAPNGERSEKIEFLADGQQIIVHGIHPRTHAEYRWEGGRSPLTVPYRDLPSIDAAQALEIVNHIVDKILPRHGYQRADAVTQGGTGGSRSTPASREDLETSIIEGDSLHDSIRDLAWRLINRENYSEEEAADHLRALMMQSKARVAERAERRKDWEERYGDINRLCRIPPGKRIPEEPPAAEPDDRPGNDWTGDPELHVEQPAVGTPADAAEDPELAEMNRKYAVIDHAGKVRVVTLYKDVLEFMAFEDFKNKYSNRRKEVVIATSEGNKSKHVPLGRWWLEHPERRQYDGLVFEPGGEREIDGKINIWQGWAYEPLEGECGLYLKFVHDVICSGNREHCEYLLNVLADAVQRPNRQGGIAVMLRSDEEGTGKTFFVKTFGKLFGRHFSKVSQPSHLTGKHNSHLEKCCVLFAEESFWAGDHETGGVLKDLITGDTLRIEPKFIDSFEVPNYLHVFTASNSRWVIPAGPTARRWFALDVSPAKRGDRQYFGAIQRQMDNRGYAALFWFLKNRDLRGFDITAVPQTRALQTQKLFSISGVDALIYHLASEGKLPCCRLSDASVAITTGEDKGEGFWAAIKTLVPEIRRMRGSISRTVANILKEDWGCQDARTSNQRAIQFPPLLELRAMFDAKFGPQEWDSTAEWIHEAGVGDNDDFPF
jgi:hypothetical protein